MYNKMIKLGPVYLIDLPIRGVSMKTFYCVRKQKQLS